MLYLEDYVELIEHLPSDLREKLTDMQDMDLQIQKNVEEVNSKAKDLFEKCAIKKSKFNGADQVFEGIRSDYYKVLGNADEKVQLASQIYDLVDRHLRKLDQELSKFKMELEADNAGITEILEQRSLELDNPVTAQRGSGRERRRTHVQPSASGASSSATAPANNGESLHSEKRLKLEDVTETELNVTHSLPQSQGTGPNFTEKSYTPVFDSNLTIPASDHIEVPDGSPDMPEASLITSGSNFDQETSASLQELNPRRVVGTKANFDTVKATELANRLNEFDRISVESLDTSGEHISDSSLSSLIGTVIQRPSRTKKQTSKAAAWVQERMQAEARHEQRKKENVPSTSGSQETAEGGSVEVAGEQPTGTEWNCDPNEPRYCLCNQVSYGEMVGCDNDKCPIEWFHYGCVGLTEAPKGKWFCPQCTQTMRRRKR